MSHTESKGKFSWLSQLKKTSGVGLHLGLLGMNPEDTLDKPHRAAALMDNLEASGLDYWALGYSPTPKCIKKNKPWIVNAGTLQGRSFRPEGQVPKGAYVVDVDSEGIQNVEFVCLDKIRLLEIEFDIAAFSDLRDLKDELTAKVKKFREQNPDQGLLIRPVLFGYGALYHELRQREKAEELLQGLREAHWDVEPFTWWDTLSNQAGPSLNYSALLKGGIFSSTLMAYVEKLSGNPKGLENFVNKVLAPVFSEAEAMGLDLDGLDWKEEEKLALLRAAESQALDLLEMRCKE